MSEYALRLENGTDTAPRVRIGDALGLTPGTDALSSRTGLRAGTGGAVTVTDGTMQVQVDPFSCWLNGGGSTTQGGYTFVLDAAKTLTLDDGDGSAARVDTIAVVIKDDTFDGSGDTSATLTVVKGIPGGGAPALPATALPLVDVNVPAGVSAGTGGLSSTNLGTDRRQYVTGLGGILPVAGATERDALTETYPGMAVYREDGDKLEVFDGTTWRAYKRDDGLKTQCGTLVVSLNNEQTDTKTVSFPQAFGGAPIVTLTTSHSDTAANHASPPSATQLSVRVFDTNNQNRTNDVTVYWIAVGPA